MFHQFKIVVKFVTTVSGETETAACKHSINRNRRPFSFLLIALHKTCYFTPNFTPSTKTRCPSFTSFLSFLSHFCIPFVSPLSLSLIFYLLSQFISSSSFYISLLCSFFTLPYVPCCFFLLILPLLPLCLSVSILIL
jgi:hypothetical protein